MTPRPTALNLATAARLETETGTVAAAKNAHGIEPPKISGHFRGHIPVTASVPNELQGNAHKKSGEMPTKKVAGKSEDAGGKNSGHSGPKDVGKSRNAHKFSPARTEWFRYEMDFRERKKSGYQVLIRRRLKWSAARYAPTVASCVCADLTERMVKSIKDGKFTAAAIAALQNGGISHEIIKNLAERIGKGNGKRATELTDHERSVLARIESGLAAGGRRRNA